jgi:hypothetical protein
MSTRAAGAAEAARSVEDPGPGAVVDAVVASEAAADAGGFADADPVGDSSGVADAAVGAEALVVDEPQLQSTASSKLAQANGVFRGDGI